MMRIEPESGQRADMETEIMAKTHSRPHVSNDNPYSEAQFKTLKYRPDYPTRFGCQTDARTWAQSFFAWYNDEHHHMGLGLLTPADVHYHRAATVLTQRQAVLLAAYQKTPELFVKGLPVPSPLPTAVWINPPLPQSLLRVTKFYKLVSQFIDTFRCSYRHLPENLFK